MCGWSAQGKVTLRGVYHFFENILICELMKSLSGSFCGILQSFNCPCVLFAFNRIDNAGPLYSSSM